MDRPDPAPAPDDAVERLGSVVREGVSAVLRRAEEGRADPGTPLEQVLADVSRLGRQALDDVRRLLREVGVDERTDVAPGIPPAAAAAVASSGPRTVRTAAAHVAAAVVAGLAVAAFAVPALRGVPLLLAGLAVVATAAAGCPAPVARAVPVAGFAIATAAALTWSGVTGVTGAGGVPVDVLLPVVLTPPAVPAAWIAGIVVRSRRRRAGAADHRRSMVAAQREEAARRDAAQRRHRLAREVHDVIAHSLVVLIAQADGGRFAAAADPHAAATALQVVVETARAVLDDPLVAAGSGATGADDAGPAGPVAVDDGVQDLVRTAQASGLSVELQVVGGPVVLASGPASAVHRVVQESLTNALKHAGPTAHVRVRLVRQARHVEVEVRDDGRGAGALIGSDGRGLGLPGMRGRVEAHGGSVDARPVVGGGFRVLARVPLGAPPGTLGALSATGVAAGVRLPGATGGVPDGTGVVPDGTGVVPDGTGVVPAEGEDASAGRRAAVRAEPSVIGMTSPQHVLSHPGPPSPSARLALRAEGLVKTYGEGPTAVHALAGVDLAVPAGTFTAIMGPSGSGKSTLMHCLAALDTPSAGRVWIGDVPVQDLGDDALTRLRREQVGFVFQGFNLLAALTARQNILLPGELAGRRPDPAWLDHLTQVLGLTGRLDHLPGELSGGQQQRVAIARALLFRPTVVMADEPTGNLDSAAGAEVLSTLRTSVRELGQTVVMVTHDAGAAAYTDRVLLLSDGRLRGRVDAPTLESVSAAMTALSAQAR